MSKQTLVELRAENKDLFAHDWVVDGWWGEVSTFVNDGWCLQSKTPTNEQLAAAMLMEAKTQDKCVECGESDPSYPIRLREIAIAIINAEHGDKLPN